MKQRPEVIVLDLHDAGDGRLRGARRAREGPRPRRCPSWSCPRKRSRTKADRVTAAGARRFLEKPFDPDELAAELAELLPAELS
jgi:CheY-like chemotaxis protein